MIPITREEINARWKLKVPLENRTRKNYSAYFRSCLVAAGRVPIMASYDAAGNCTLCGEAGRCSGWHWKGETI
jgi:hypothetical protein